MFIFNPFSERQKMNVLAPLAGTPVRAFERRGQLERGANGAEARRHLRSFAAPRSVGERQRLKPKQINCDLHADN